MKFLIICALVLSASAVLGDSTGQNNAEWGQISASDRLIRRDVILSDPSFTGKAKKTYTFPSADTPALFPYTIISAVKALDHYEEGTGGEATLLAGGPNSRDVTIKLKSQLFRGFHFVIEIWGH